MRNEEMLAAYQLMYKALGEEVSTSNPGNLRSVVDAEYREVYEQTGAKSFNLRVPSGAKVGTYTVVENAPKEQTRTTRFVIKDYEALAQWLDGECDKDAIFNFAASQLTQFAEWYFDTTGELPKGCELHEVISPALLSTYKNGQIKLDKKMVGEVKRLMSESAMNLLGDGGHE